jgi:hypothetical protein
MELIKVSDNNKPIYVPLKDAMKEVKPPPQKEEIIRSRVLIIEKLTVTISQDFDGQIDFVLNTDPGILSDHKTIPELDITAKEPICFDEDMTLSKLESVIRRCGILEKYEAYFTKDPDIVINCYELKIKKKYRFFREFNEGIMTAGDIFE